MRTLISFMMVLCFCAGAGPAAAHDTLRIISLAPATTEILFALGLDKQIIGISSYCNYPEQAKNKDRVGTFSEPNIEKIISLKPDMIFCTGLEQAPIVENLRKLGFIVYVSDPVNIAGLFSSIIEIGRATGKQAEAAELVTAMKQNIDEISSRVQSVPKEKKPKVFIEIWHDPLMTAGNHSYIDQLISLAGGINIAFDTRRPYSCFSVEQVIKRDPDCIILAYMTGGDTNPLDILKNRIGWKDISAVKNKRVFNDMNPDLFLRPGPRLPEALRLLYSKLYPQT
ncbi:MAG: cobalamin-binding protein [Candidatus Omnitrophica bacterium]|nr:cobalamin-binding protein [Candidatus Omnitrophota bacterium]